jgi:GT2 family glycosyltransferase/SAM-dependent methyltransferase
LNKVVLNWLSRVASSRDFEEPVVEFGALQVEGQEGFADLRKFFPGKEYVGCDLVKGKGVDRLDNLEFSHFAPNSIGTVLCLETLEHVEHPWEAAKEIFRILKPGGLVLISIPFHFPVHCYPDDYWRMTSSGLEALLGSAGFQEITTGDSGEDVEWDLYWDRPQERPHGTEKPLVEERHFPFSVFGSAVKPDAEKAQAGQGAAGATAVQALVIRETAPEVPFKGRVPIIVVLYHREEDTKEMMRMLDKVTSDYDLILVDNGFNDSGYLHQLRPVSYLKNDDNVGIIKAINQGLEAAQGPYIAVLHSDLLIYEEGWLDHIIEFMERRPDVGLVSMAGRHSVDRDGRLDDETLVCPLPEYPYSTRPTWRFTEIAAADGIALIMRDIGFRLDESLGAFHYYDIDLSMQYIAAGYRVYNANIEFYHLREKYYKEGQDVFAAMTSGSAESANYLEARARFREKWSHMLPISKGFAEEQYVYFRVQELLDKVSEFESYIEKVNHESEARGQEIERAKVYVANLENQIVRVTEECQQRYEEVEKARESMNDLVNELTRARNVIAGTLPAGSSVLERLGFYLRTEGARATFLRIVGRLRPRGE